jgi:hypothetical protein
MEPPQIGEADQHDAKINMAKIYLSGLLEAESETWLC